VVGWGVLVREVLISGGVLALAAAGARRVEVRLAGKAGTLCVLVAFPLFMMGTPGPWGWPALVIAWAFAIPGLVFAWYAIITYVPMARRALAEARAARVEPGTQPEPEPGPEAAPGVSPL
jgi:cardiolipin synthase